MKNQHNHPDNRPDRDNDEMLGQLLEALGEGKEAPKKRLDPWVYLEMLLRRRWHFLLPVLLVAAIGIAVVIRMPKVYEASTLILVQAQKVPSDYVRPVVADDLETRISTISQQINSRSNLERIIEEFKLFDGIDYQDMFIEDKLAILRENIKVDLHRASRRDDPDSFTVSFQGKNPRTVRDVANTLAQNFIDENLKMREAQVFATDAFIDNQLGDVRGRLQDLEQRLQGYRATHMGGLPEQLDTNLQMLERLEIQLSDRQASIRDAKNRLLLINQQMTELRGYQSQMAAAATGQAPDAPVDDHTRLRLLQRELAEMEDKYTERHPDVIRLRERVQTLEERIAADGGGAEGASSGAALSAGPPFLMQQMTTLLAQRTEAQQEIAAMEQEVPGLRTEIQRLQTLIDETPKREQELLSLRRDYQNLTASYNSLLDRKHQAEIALNLERAQSGEQFRILDRAQLPNKPSKPDMHKLLILIVGAALATGGGLVVVTEYLDTSFRSMGDASEKLGLPLLATLPFLEEKRSRGRVMLNHALTALSVTVAAGIFGVLALMTVKGVDSTLQIFRDLL